MDSKDISGLFWLVVFLMFCLWGILSWQRGLARKRFLAAIKTLAKGGRHEIGGQPVEHWLDILNRGTAQSLVAINTMVLTYKGHKFFFIDGGINYIAQGKWSPYYYRRQKTCLLVAVGEPAVRLLSEDERVFHKMTGSTELAAFSIFRWSEFSCMLMAEKRQ
jgi:hypothetical protein